MRSHKSRLDKLAARLGPVEDETITIQLMWGDEPMGSPITYKRGDYMPFTQVVNALQKGRYTGGKITMSWPDETCPET